MAFFDLFLPGILLVLLVKQASLLLSPIGASHEEIKATHPHGLFSKSGEFPYQVP